MAWVRKWMAWKGVSLKGFLLKGMNYRIALIIYIIPKIIKPIPTK